MIVLYKQSDLPTVIKNARTKKGLSQSDLAEKLYISKQSISKYENGKAIPSEDILIKLEKELDINLQTLFENHTVVLSKRTSYMVITGALLGVIVIIALSVSLLTLRSTLRETTYEHNTLNAAHDELQSEHTSLQTEYDALNMDNNNLHSDYNQLTSIYTSLSDDYDTLYSNYQRVINNNVLDYAGVDIIFTGDYTIYSQGKIEFTLLCRNTSTASFTFDSRFITIKIKDTARDTLYETAVPGMHLQGLSPSSSYTGTLTTDYITSYTSESIEWFEIFYGGMLVAHIAPNDIN